MILLHQRELSGKVVRIIRTEMYFDSELVRGLSGHETTNPGISIAWFKDVTISVNSIADLPDGWKPFDTGDIETFLAQSLIGFREIRHVRPLPGQIMARSTIESFSKYVLDQPIVIERSPPDGLPFKELVKDASGAFIGTYLGMQIAGEQHLLLLLTVPGGIMLISSAIGISKALENGFNKMVARLFSRK